MNELEIKTLRDCTIKAIEYLDKNHWDSKNNSRTGDLIFNGKLYPTKPILWNLNEQIKRENLKVKIPNNISMGEELFLFFENLGFKIKRKKKGKNIHEVINELLKTDSFLSLMNNSEFYFSKICKLKNEYDNYSISSAEIDYILEKYVQNYTTNYENFCDNIYEPKIKDFAIIIGKLIAHIDLKASGKNKWNTYDDKRIIANSSVRQTNWVSFFCNLKKDSNYKNEGSIQNAWNYVCQPENNFTILSNNHRKLISEKILQSEFKDENFCNQLIEWFKTNHQEAKTLEIQNYTYLISCLIYNKNVLPFWKLEDINYWIFQGNPKIFDFETALKENILTDWTVSNHKDRIKAGDKVILWITGNNSGCYALAEVASKPKEKKNSPDSHLWKESDKSELKANIKITHNLVDEPISKEEILKIAELSELKVGNQGTNFTATQEEFEILLSIIENNSNRNNSTMKDNTINKKPLNQILYGAPGTGKTYTTKKLAIEIIDGKEYLDSTKEDRDIILARYNELALANQIHFTTFHQSMSYEDFIEGIKPVLKSEPEIDEKEKKEVTIEYEIKNGIFKKMCRLAEGVTATVELLDNIDFKNKDFYKMSLGGKNRLDKHNWSMKNNLIFLGWGGDTDFSELNKVKDWKLFRDKFNNDFPDLVKESKYVIQAVYIFQKMKIGDIVVISKGNKIIDAIGIIESEYFYDDTKEIDNYQFRKVKWIATNLDSTTDIFVHKEISQQTIYQFYNEDVKIEAFNENFKKETKNNNRKKYVLIIDEINRGNVSSIFGELITLLEEDKRKENKEEIEVILPYSQDKFSVPNNLYIIGTMNTADRSVESLDTALRRRFSFVEMPSKPEKLVDIILEDAEEINLVQLLEKINQRIELLIDKDHQIGHSFFINLKDLNGLKAAFKNKIIPLLEEYFFGDFGKIGLVLGSRFVETKNDNSNILADFKDYEDVNFITEKKIYIIKDCEKLEPKDFISIYSKINNE